MKRVQLRVVEASDAGAVAEIYGAVVAGTAISFEIEPPDAVEMSGRMAAALPLYPWLVCTVGDAVVGYAYAGRHHVRHAYQWSVDATVYIAEGHRGRSIGRALYTALFEVLRAQGFFAVHAGITLPNAGSVALHEKMGFRPVGVYRAVGYKMGAWHDVGWWQLELRARVGEPAPWAPFADLRDDPRCAAALARGAAVVRG